VANPQLENGYIKIATEIMEALTKYRIPGEQMQCLLFIIRKTYGWNKKEDSIALIQFVDATGINMPNVCRALKGLIDKNIIIKKDNRAITKYLFNKRYKTWKPLSKKITVIKKDNLGLSKKIDTIDTITKDIKKIYKRKIPDVFPLTNNLKEYAFKKGIFKNEVEEIFEHFKNYHGSNGTQKVKWDLCWYTWVRNEIKFNPEKYAISPEQRQDSIEEQCS